MEELFSRDLVRRWLKLRDLAAMERLQVAAGVEPRAMQSPTGKSTRYVFTRPEVMKLLATYYAKKGERLMHESEPPPTTSEEEA